MTVYDAMAVVGVALVGAGLWLVSPAASLGAVGVLLLTGGVLGARRDYARTQTERFVTALEEHLIRGAAPSVALQRAAEAYAAVLREELHDATEEHSR